MPLSTDTLTYSAAIEFLYSRVNYETTSDIPYRGGEFRLARMRDLLSRLNDPQTRMPIVHVAGTKGKGSTATMIASVLERAGYCTGLYTSPHLNKIEERAAVDGVACSESELVDLVATIMPVVQAMDDAASLRGRRGPTFFEITTALALLHFERRQVDLVVLEVGLGGRLDSTNVCAPLVSVITSISFDHTHLLGNTLAEIAGEKAGIIKPGVPVVTGVTQDEPLNVIRSVAARHGCEMLTLGEDFEFDYVAAAQASPRHCEMSYRPRDRRSGRQFNGLRLKLLGRHQAANAAVVVATLERLRDLGWELPEQAIRDGLANASFPARIEVIAQRPTIVVDAAHNCASIEALVATLDESFPPSPRLLIFATSRDKDARGMLRLLLPKFDEVIVTRFVGNPRSAPPEDLLALAHGLCAEANYRGPSLDNIRLAPDPQSAWQSACDVVSRDHLLCITGSSFVAAEIRAMILSSADKTLPLPVGCVTRE